MEAGAPEPVEAMGLSTREFVVAVGLAVAGNFATDGVKEVKALVEQALAEGPAPLACVVEDVVPEAPEDTPPEGDEAPDAPPAAPRVALTPREE